MNKVAIASYGNTKFVKDDMPIESLLLSSTKSLFNETPNLEQKDIDAVIVSTNDNSKYLSTILSELSGISPKVSHTVESLCNSGTNSIISAYTHIASGLADIALVVGADRRDSPGQILKWDKSRGEYNHPIFWGTMFTKSHMRKYNTTKEDLARVSVQNHKNAQNNPYAFSNKIYSVDDVMNSDHLTEDLRILDCSRPCSGSSAILLASENIAKKYTEDPIWIKGIGQKSLSAGFAKNEDFTSMESTKQATKMALDMAKLEIPDIDLIELHDAFTICEIMAIEDIGLASKGDGASMVQELFNSNDNKINPRGGLIGAGHPLGATGIAQTIEVTQQLQHNAEKRQLDKADVGLVHNMSAAATSSTILVLGHE